MIEFNLNFVFTIINLIVLYILLKKFLFGRVNKILEERQALADSQIAQAEDTKKEAEALKDQYQSDLDNVEKLKADAVKEAAAEADKKSAKIIENADAQAAEIIAAARAESEKEHDLIISSAHKEIVDLVSGALDQVAINGKETVTDNSALLDEFLKKAGETE